MVDVILYSSLAVLVLVDFYQLISFTSLPIVIVVDFYHYSCHFILCQRSLVDIYIFHDMLCLSMGILVDFYHFVTFILSHIHVVTVVDFYFSNIFFIFYYDWLILCMCIPCLPIYNVLYTPHCHKK